MGNEQEVRKTKVAVIFPHPTCNMACSFCITEDNFDAMTLSQGKELLLFLKDQDISSIVVGGGEPFLWSPILDFLKTAKSLGFFVQVGTNGTILPDGFENFDFVDRYVLPLDSTNADLHNRLRIYSKESHHNLIMDRLHRLMVAGKSVTVSTVVTHVNLPKLESIGDFLTQYSTLGGKIHAWHIYQFLPHGRGGSAHAAELLVDPGTYDQLVDSIKENYPTLKVFRRKDMYHSREVDFFWYHDQRICRMSEL